MDLMENTGSRAVARAALALAMTSTREEEAALRAQFGQDGVLTAAADYGGDYNQSVMKLIERAVVAARREHVIADAHHEQGAVAGAAHDAIAQVSAKAFGLSSTDLIGLNSVPLSLHIHDNFGIKWDEHLIPGDGNIDWEQFLRILKQIGYPGEFVIEAHHQTLDTEDDKRDAILEELLRRAKKMTAALETL